MNQDTSWNAAIISACLQQGAVCGPQHPTIPSPLFARVTSDNILLDSNEYLVLVYSPALKAFNRGPQDAYTEEDIARWLNDGTLERISMHEFMKHASLPDTMRINVHDASETNAVADLWDAPFSIVSILDKVAHLAQSKIPAQYLAQYPLFIENFTNQDTNTRMALYIFNRVSYKDLPESQSLDPLLTEQEINFVLSTNWPDIKPAIEMAMTGKNIEWEEL